MKSNESSCSTVSYSKFVINSGVPGIDKPCIVQMSDGTQFANFAAAYPSVWDNSLVTAVFKPKGFTETTVDDLPF